MCASQDTIIFCDRKWHLVSYVFIRWAWVLTCWQTNERRKTFFLKHDLLIYIFNIHLCRDLCICRSILKNFWVITYANSCTKHRLLLLFFPHGIFSEYIYTVGVRFCFENLFIFSLGFDIQTMTFFSLHPSPSSPLYVYNWIRIIRHSQFYYSMSYKIKFYC